MQVLGIRLQVSSLLPGKCLAILVLFMYVSCVFIITNHCDTIYSQLFGSTVVSVGVFTICNCLSVLHFSL